MSALGDELKLLVLERTLVSLQNGQFLGKAKVAALIAAFECSRFAHDGPGYVWFNSSVFVVPHGFEEFSNIHLSLVFE